MSDANKSESTDQADILAQNAQLVTDLATAKQTIGTLQGQVTTATAATAASDAALIAARAANVLSESNLATANAEIVTLKASQTEFDKRVAAELAKHGIRAEAVAIKPDPERKLTATEKCQAAKAPAK